MCRKMRRDRRKPARRARRMLRLRGKLEEARRRPQAHWIRARWSNGGNRFWRRREPWRLLRNGLPGSRRRFPLWTRMRFHAAKFSAGAKLWSKNDWPKCRSSLKNKEPSFWRCRKKLGGLGCTPRFTTRSASGNFVSLRNPSSFRAQRGISFCTRPCTGDSSLRLIDSCDVLLSFAVTPRELSLRSHVKVYGVGILPSGADEHVSLAKLHKISVGKDNLKLRRADEPGALRNVVPEDHGIGAEIRSHDGHREGNAIDRHSTRREFH